MKQPPTWRQTSRHPATCPPTRLHRPTHPWSHRPTRRLIRVPIHLSSHPAICPPTRLHRPNHPWSQRPTRRLIRVPIHRSSHPPPHHPGACQRRLPYPAPPRIPTIPPTCPLRPHPRSTTARPNTRTPCSHPRRPTRRAPSYIPAACSHPRSTTPDHPLATLADWGRYRLIRRGATCCARPPALRGDHRGATHPHNGRFSRSGAIHRALGAGHCSESRHPDRRASYSLAPCNAAESNGQRNRSLFADCCR